MKGKNKIVTGFKIKIGDKIKFEYTNFQGINSNWEILVKDIWFGETAWNPEPGIFFEGVDLKKDITRYFYAIDMTEVKRVT